MVAKKKKKKKSASPFEMILSIVLFFIFAPKLIRAAWKMGHDYTYSKNGSGFYHLTKKIPTAHTEAVIVEHIQLSLLLL